MAEESDLNGNSDLRGEMDDSTQYSSSEQESDRDSVDPQKTLSPQAHAERRSSNNKLDRFPASASQSLHSSSTSSASLSKAKIILSGQMGVGKSTFLRNFARAECGVLVKADDAHVTRILKHGDKDIEVHLLDTSGQERYRSLTASYYRNANGCLLLFNYNKSESFYNLHMWLEDIQKYCIDDQIDIVIVGFDNKATTPIDSDPPDASTVPPDPELPTAKGKGKARYITSQQAQQFADNHCLHYIDVTNDPGSVVRVIYCILQRIIDRAAQNSSCTKNNIIRPGSSEESSEGHKCCPC